MTIVIQPQFPVIILITTFIVVVLKIINTKLEAYDSLTKPSLLVTLCIMLVEYIDSFVSDIVTKEKAKTLAPYICSVAIYIICCNYSGMFGLDSPTKNWSVTLVLAAITFIWIQKTDIEYSGIKSYIKAFFEPIFVFLVPNFFGTIAPLLSMSLRLFGNLLSGTIIMELVYNLGNMISNFFWGIFGLKDIFNFIGPVIAAPLHVYFDLFSGFMQTYIFIMLTAVFIGNKIPEESRK